MNIVVVGNLYPPIVFGGYEILCEQVVRSLRRRGHAVHVLTSRFGAENAPSTPDVTRTLHLTTEFPRPGETVGHVDFSPRRMQAVASINHAHTLEVLDREQPDLVFAWCLNRLSLGPLFAARARGVPICYTINDEHPRQFRFERMGLGFRRLARFVAQRTVWPMATMARLEPPAMTVISEALRRRLLDQAVPVEGAVVLHQGIDLDEIAYAPRAREPGEPLRVMFAGQLSEAKGVHTIIEAMGVLAQAGRHDVHLDVLGDGVADYEARLKGRVSDLGLDGQVEFLGRRSHDGVCQAYHDHHVLVFSSEWQEPFGLVHLEAMAAGCTVVSTTTGGSAELIRDGENALAYEAGASRALAEALRRLLDDEPLRRSLAKGGRAWVEAHHDFERYVDSMEKWIVRVADRPDRGRPRVA